MVGTREEYVKRTPLAECAFNADCTTETMNDFTDYGKPEAVARGFGSKDRVKHSGLCLRRHATPSIGDLHLQVIALSQAFRGCQPRVPSYCRLSCGHADYSILIS